MKAQELFPYTFDEAFKRPVAYFSMEFAIDQALKTYSGGLGFLAGSHMRSVNDRRQNTIGVGILWSYGYYDQGRHEDNTLKVEYRRKFYYFLKETGITVEVEINGKPVFVKAYLLPAETFESAPVILLSTDIFENDHLSRTITHKLYDANEETRVAQEIVLGIGGTRVLKALGLDIDIYHLNEGHALPLAFELMKEYPELEELKKHIVFTTHTPEMAGNETHDAHFLERMGFFNGFSLDEVREKLDYHDADFSLTVGALKVSKRANAVSKIHEKVANEMWKNVPGRCEIISITNAQNMRYWSDKQLMSWMLEHEDYQLVGRKKHLKHQLFEEVADQTGKLFDPDVLTLVWARRFAEYKRPKLLIRDMERFKALIHNSEYPIQIIWAGKPYPLDQQAINEFNDLVRMSREFKNVAVLTGYELRLSKLLKQGSDVWLNTPRWGREASGTSGMSAGINASVHFSIDDGWHAEFGKDGVNSFTIPHADPSLPVEEIDRIDYERMMEKLEKVILPTYYDQPDKWLEIVKNGMNDIYIGFNTQNMVERYYKELYNYEPETEG
ncbi:alpha-glucan family phosphorylase [Nitratifractor salsuginis]|uniref:Alpha-glucan phosphorylase n=1 Tax=Nitratifractor salsuginis (strain DSM 16511 / JCM 12458 / E9I37-1) TaxID=749222 RepID=E6X3I9_NITSE|nr:alpha-glucan family phosphorylase [Nitratifractor salsuginis]ADV46266.1 alpha-glucan phosphorylase [Nitratifractor salsuginis DSM 16511]